MSYKLIVSPVFKITLQRLCSFLTRKYTKELSQKTKLLIKNVLSTSLIENPFIGPECDRLIELGVYGYRQLLIDDHNIVIYRIDEAKHEIIVLLVFDSRQSLEKLLSEVNLIV